MNIHNFWTSFIVFSTLVFPVASLAQVSPSETDFIAPMDIPLVVAGNFGEVRSNHFHTGLDLKTQGVVCKKIRAIDTGYISRIAYSHYGYGRVIYVSHPNGYTSVYAHLSKFPSFISSRVRAYQYENKSEVFNWILDSNEIEVAKGTVIAYSGNSGSSSAPHLHFEIRETQTENPMNPLLFGIKIKDKLKPMIKHLKVYPLDNNSLVNGKYMPATFLVNKNKKGRLYLRNKIQAFGNVGFSIHALDKMNSKNICGVYSLDLRCGDSLIFGHKMEKLDFSTNRYVNHHVDYKLHKKNNKTYHKSFLKGNNKLPIYEKGKDGIVNVKQDSVYEFLYRAKDYSGNEAKFDFVVIGDSNKRIIKERVNEKVSKVFMFDAPNYFDTAGFSLLMTPNTLYENLNFYFKMKKNSNFSSYIYDVTNSYVGIQKKYKLIIPLNNKIDSAFRDKLLIVLVKPNGKISSRGGSFQNGKMTTRVREFGSFAVKIDTTKPSLKLLTSLSQINKNSVFKFKIGDNLAGIKSYSILLDNEWILSRYQPKKRLLTLDLSEKKKLVMGAHFIKVEIEDARGNKKIQQFDFKIN